MIRSALRHVRRWGGVAAFFAAFITLAVHGSSSARLPSDEVPRVDPSAGNWVLGEPVRLPTSAFRRVTEHQRQQVAAVVVASAVAHGVDPAFALAVAVQESGLRPAASVTGPPTRYGRAVGTMQVLPATGRSQGCGNLRDQRANVDCGVRYLAQGIRRCRGDLGCAARFYHGGPNTRIHGPLTAHYGRTVLARYARTGGRVHTASLPLRGLPASGGRVAEDERYPHTFAYLQTRGAAQPARRRGR